MKLSFVYTLLSLALGLVYAAPTSSDKSEGNCFSLTFPTNGTTWYDIGSYIAYWSLHKECKDTYYTYLIEADVKEDGEYTLGAAFKSEKPLDMNRNSSIIETQLRGLSGDYVFVISKETGEDIGYDDLALIKVVKL
ncbi:hypothetical protein CLU79DRAFT_761706 [Phycomyces nitens]|nr:hypothetical protein CLU79DRAFT_761706 [Phycomyces nitens]